MDKRVLSKLNLVSEMSDGVILPRKGSLKSNSRGASRLLPPQEGQFLSFEWGVRRVGVCICSYGSFCCLGVEVPASAGHDTRGWS